MLIRDATPALRRSLEAAGLAMHQLDPWEAWKVFKQWLRVEIEDGYDTVCMQFLPIDPEGDPIDEATLLFVRQFKERQDAEDTDELIGRIVLELRYPAAKLLAFPPVDVWGLDFPTLEEWASVVEGNACFQQAMAIRPLFSDVFYDEEPEEDQ